MVYRLGDYWLDVGRGFSSKKISANLESALRLGQEQKFRVVWLDSNTFKLTQGWWPSTGETWRRQFGNRRTDRWHYDPDHYIPSRWVDGRGWVPDKSEQKADTTTSTPSTRRAPNVSADTGSGFEGQYVETGVENSFLTITADHWSIGGTMKMEYLYTAKKTGANTYEVDLKTANRILKGMDMKSVVRKEGDFLFINNNGTGEIKYARKK